MNASLLGLGELQVLGCLLREPAGVEAASLHQAFGLSPSQTQAAVHRLAGLGCVTEPRGIGGYRLGSSGLNVWAEYLEHVFAQAGTPRQVEVYRRTSSTQDRARGRAGERILIVTDEQEAGRGRLGRRWTAPPGLSALLSMTHALDAPGESADRAMFVTAVAAARAVERLIGRGVSIKWPNDLIVEGRKLGGILVETVGRPGGGRTAVIGLGLNILSPEGGLSSLPADVGARFTSLRWLGSSHDRLHVIAEVVAEIDRMLASADDSQLLEEWRARNLLRDQRVSLRSGDATIRGVVVDLDPSEGLIIRRDSGEMVHLPAATTTML